MLHMFQALQYLLQLDSGTESNAGSAAALYLGNDLFPLAVIL